MALINCPECNKDISDKAAACPSCGFPIQNSSPAAEEIQCPEFPMDMEVGKQILSLSGDTQCTVKYDRGENEIAIEKVPPGGTMNVVLCANGIGLRVLMFKIMDIHHSQIISMKETTNQELLKVDKSTIGRAVVGGLILGPLGAVIGGMSALGGSSKIKNKYYLIINYWDAKNRKATSLLLGSDRPVSPFISRVKKEGDKKGWKI